MKEDQLSLWWERQGFREEGKPKQRHVETERPVQRIAGSAVPGAEELSWETGG